MYTLKMDCVYYNMQLVTKSMHAMNLRSMDIRMTYDGLGSAAELRSEFSTV